MFYKHNVEAVLRKYQMFWASESNEPIIMINVPQKEEDIWGTKKWLKLSSLNQKEILSMYEGLFEGMKEIFIFDDTVPAAYTGLRDITIGVILGCPIKFTEEVSSAEPIIHEWTRLKDIRFDSNNYWLRKILRDTRYLVEKAKGRFGVGISSMGGPGETMSQLRGTENLCMDFYYNPEKVHKLARICTEAIIKFRNLQKEIIGDFHGGTCVCYPRGLWMPGKSALLQEDFSLFVSPEIFREFLLPYNKEIIENLDHSLFHIHSSGLHILDDLLEIKKLDAIQITLDPTNRALEPLMSIFKKIQKKGCFLFISSNAVPLTPAEIKTLIDELEIQKLGIINRCNSFKEGRRLIGKIKSWVRNKHDNGRSS
jgi:hypothetical protein